MTGELLRSIARRVAVPVMLAMGSLLAGAAHAADCPTTTESPVPCASHPGDYQISVQWDGQTRNVLIHVPQSYTGNAAVPLLLDLHGFTSSAAEERSVSGQLAQSDKRGFIAVWPDGINNAWNAYPLGGASDLLSNTEQALGQKPVDDVGFLRHLIAQMKIQANIDASRVFMTGISNGAYMTQRMACESADLLRAVVAVSGALDSPTCKPSKPITQYEIAATGDQTVPYYGWQYSVLGQAGQFRNVVSAFEALQQWKGIDGCTDDFSKTVLANDASGKLAANAVEFKSCQAGVKVGLVTIIGGQHVLYDTTKVPAIASKYGSYTPPIDPAEYIWSTVFNL